MLEWTEKKKKTWNQRFVEQPHQMFFGFSIIWSILIMFLSLFSFIGIFGNFSQIHSFGITYGVFANAFLGFLFTVIPRYTQGTLIKHNQYIPIFVLFQIGILIFLFGFDAFGKTLVSLSLIGSFVLFIKTIKEARIKNQNESLWLTFLILVGGILPLCQILFDLDLTIYSLWFFIFPLVYVVTQRMIPAFFAVYFKESVAEKPVWNLPIYMTLFFAIGILWNNKFIVSILSLLLFVAVCYFIYNAKIFRKAIPILNILSVAVAWLAIGIFALFVESFLQLETLKLSTHILLLGFVFTLLIGFGTRVILGHSGRKLETDNATLAIFAGTQIVIFARILTSIYFINELPWIAFVHISFSLWIVLFLVWGAKYGKILFRISE